MIQISKDIGIGILTTDYLGAALTTYIRLVGGGHDRSSGRGAIGHQIALRGAASDSMTGRATLTAGTWWHVFTAAFSAEFG